MITMDKFVVESDLPNKRSFESQMIPIYCPRTGSFEIIPKYDPETLFHIEDFEL